MEKGYLQVYTGDGKGKSTAAFGLALRARGAGLSVTILQFIKNGRYSETNMLRQAGVILRQHGTGLLFGREPDDAAYAAAEKGLMDIESLFDAGTTSPDLLILDEVNVALGLGLVEESRFLNLLDRRPPGMELVCTGRRAPESLVSRADLVSEIHSVKHYYKAGVIARFGIEK